jgi:hypothetical protein
VSAFLQFVGGMVLAVGAVLLVGLAILVFRSRTALRRAMRAAALADAPITPARITLVPAAEIAFRDRERCEADRTALRAAGYRDLGGFHIREMPGVRLAALHHPERHAFAVLYDHDQVGAFCDLYLPLPADGAITVSSAPTGGELDPVPGQIKRFLPGRPIAELLARFDAETADDEPRRVAPADFAAEFEHSYAKEMDWRNARGGPTEEEARRIAQRMPEAVSDEDIAMVREHMAATAAAQLEEACLEQFLSNTHLSPMQWEKIREQVCVVHARMTSRDAGQLFLSSLGGDGAAEPQQALDAEAERLAAETTDPREVFARLNERLTGIRYVKLGEVAEPVAADVYRAP